MSGLKRKLIIFETRKNMGQEFTKIKHRRNFFRLMFLCLEFVLLFLVFSILRYHVDTVYSMQQLRGFVHDMSHPARLEMYLEEGKIGKDNWFFFHSLFDFSISRLGMNSGDSYQWAIDPEPWPSITMITACDTTSVKPYAHSLFGLIEFPYLGFYDKQAAVAYVRDLKRKGMTVSLSPVSGFSLGGWLPDPFIIPWFKKQKGELAELIFHELAHRTWYDAGNLVLSEQFASVVGKQGAELFLKDYYGADSEEYRRYVLYCRNNDAVEDFAFRMIPFLNKQLALPITHPDYIHHRNLFKNIADKALQDTSMTAKVRIKIAAAVLSGRNAWFASQSTYNERNNDVYRFFKEHCDSKAELLIDAFVKGKYQGTRSSK